MSEDDEIVGAFLEESRENLDQLDRDLVELESRPGDPALLARVFRTVHTIKGTCGFLGYRRLEALAHAGESLLGSLRSGDLVLTPAVTTSLLALIDAVRRVLGRIEATGGEGDEDHAALVAQLAGHLDGALPPAPATSVMEAPAVEGGTVTSSPAAAETTVRVDVAVLDRLLDLLGELVLARSRIGDFPAAQEGGELAPAFRQLRLVTNELQDQVMRARLQPVGTVTGKLRRIGRDLATALAKRVVVQVEGEQVGVDKAVNEALRDPLLHLVRNAIDHGIEPPAERSAAGKPEEGTLRVRTWHQGGRVHVEVSDDGRGVDVARLVSEAVAAGLVAPDRAAEMSREDAVDLMFRPGLSTKSEVTSVSGRGVGMDVVRANLEQVGGSIAITSEPGRGTTFHINVPLSLAILPAVVTWCGGNRYVVPQVDVQEVVRIDAADVASAVHDVAGCLLLRLRGRLLPLVDLSRTLGLGASGLDGAVHVVVVAGDGRRFGLVVDAVADTTDAVVKPLTRATRAVPVFAGATILGDGRPSLILDVAGVAAYAGVEAAAEEAPSPVVPDEPGDGGELLVARTAGGGRLAVPLGAVRRLERFPTERIERTGSLDVVQYGDAILPLVRVADDGPGPGAPEVGRAGEAEVVHAVVCSSAAGLVGVVVDGIVDVVPAPATPAQPPTRPGVAARLVVDGALTELVDIDEVVAGAGLRRPA